MAHARAHSTVGDTDVGSLGDFYDDDIPVCSVVVDGKRRACVSVGGDPAIDPYEGEPFVAEFLAACARIADARGHLDADDADHGDADDVDPHRPRVTDDGLTFDNDDTFGSDE